MCAVEEDAEVEGFGAVGFAGRSVLIHSRFSISAVSWAGGQFQDPALREVERLEVAN